VRTQAADRRAGRSIQSIQSSGHGGRANTRADKTARPALAEIIRATNRGWISTVRERGGGTEAAMISSRGMSIVLQRIA
jgi:hypothetical protein